jgi:hypothetical protein
MRTAGPAEPGKSVAVTVIGLLTLLFGVAYAVLGCNLVFAGAFFAIPPGDPAGGFAWLLQFLAGLVILYLATNDHTTATLKRALKG